MPDWRGKLPLHWWETSLHLDHLESPRNLLDWYHLALPRSRTDLTRTLPLFRRGDIAIPERPGSTLGRPHGIDGTAFLSIVKNAIAIASFAERSPPASFAAVQVAHHLQRLTEEPGNRCELLIGHPDKSGIARAALAATSALERQPISIPRLIAAILLLVHESPSC
jgi:hypothetical protein